MIRVGIIGASGMAGSAIYKLASTKKDLNVTGIVRNESKARKILGDDANLISGDIFALNDSLLSRFDVIVDAYGTSPENADRQVKLAEKLVVLARKQKIRLILFLVPEALKLVRISTYLLMILKRCLVLRHGLIHHASS